MPPIMWRTAPTVPPPPTIQQALRACRGLTVSDLKQDPNLLDALRRLRAATTGVDDVGRAKSASALIIKTTDINAIRGGLTANFVVRDPEMRQQLRYLRSRTQHLKLARDARKLSAVGELGRHLPGPPHAAGKPIVASIGNGWVGPHRSMESYRRLTGPGKR